MLLNEWSVLEAIADTLQHISIYIQYNISNLSHVVRYGDDTLDVPGSDVVYVFDFSFIFIQRLYR